MTKKCDQSHCGIWLCATHCSGAGKASTVLPKAGLKKQLLTNKGSRDSISKRKISSSSTILQATAGGLILILETVNHRVIIIFICELEKHKHAALKQASQVNRGKQM